MATMPSEKEFVEKLESSVIFIVNEGVSYGTGVIYSENGLALTNEHVIRGAKKIQVTAINASGKKQTLPAEVLGADSGVDLAVIRFEGGPYVKAKLGSNKDFHRGLDVIAIGYPQPEFFHTRPGDIGENLTIVSTWGKVSAIGTDWIMHQASVNGGNSGGPLFSKADGSVVGINNSIKRFLPTDQPGDERSLIEGFNFAIAIDEANSRIKELETGTVVPNNLERNAFINSGNSHYANGQYESAIRDYTSAICLNPCDYVPYTSRGHSYYALGQSEAAIQNYGAAIRRINPHLFGSAGDHAELVANYVLSETYNGRGNAYYYLGEYKPAIRDYNKAIKLSRRGNAMAYNGKGNAYNSLGQYERAIREYSRAININGQIAIFYNNRSDAYAKASAQDKAKARELGYKP